MNECDRNFLYGFECGKLYEQMKRRQPIIGIYHTVNLEQIQMLCENYQYVIARIMSIAGKPEFVEMELSPSY
ncbi:hypothetical protein [Scytonema sp. NUACC26]|uniref:hypothetical protein n=1 Tax=Scytonema sp. NUACC26 TaxID=3140176 RepID=UPI0034DC7A19